jgi:carboxymethylenebutenolidase
MEMYVYDAEHAFVYDSRPVVYYDVCAKQALDRALAFLKKHTA